MSYEYMSGLGTDKTANAASQNAEATLQPSPGWMNPEQATAYMAQYEQQALTEAIGLYEQAIAQIRDGDEEARRALRIELTHSDNVEALAACERPENATTGIRREYCEVLNLAKQVAEGNDPQVRQRRLLIAGGVGAGVLALLGLVLVLK